VIDRTMRLPRASSVCEFGQRRKRQKAMGKNAASENFDVYAHVKYLYKPEQSDPVGTEVFGGR
jgi:hypothetical protein